MPTWSSLISQAAALPPDQLGPWLQQQITQSLDQIGTLRGGTNVVFYASAFLQKARAPFELTAITSEDVNGFMAMVHRMDCTKPLTLLLHTPGGVTNAAESIVDYLRSKFQRIEVAVPTYAMSAGTMIALASERILMGRQSQLGPIDPQLPVAGGQISARAVVEQFEEAKKQIVSDPRLAHAWAPVLQSLGPSLLLQAKYALAYGEQMVARWLAAHMFATGKKPKDRGKKAAEHFNDADKHKSHGRRIGRDEARRLGIDIEDLEQNQALQDAVLTAYHLMTIAFEKTPLAKALMSNTGNVWIKNWVTQVPGMMAPN